MKEELNEKASSNIENVDEKTMRMKEANELEAYISESIKNGVVIPGISGDSVRVAACAGKSYGASCSFKTNTGSTQQGICIYNKWGIFPDRTLFCANKDYKGGI